MKILVATTNRNKVREVTSLVAHLKNIEWVTLDNLLPMAAPEESGETFWENARQKALAYSRASGLTVVAEDSGLEVAALGGIPGVHSARFLGPDVPYPVRFQEIKKRLAEQGAARSDARFVTALAVARGEEILFETQAWVDGEIAEAPVGDKGFGYDPLFFYPPQ